MKRIRLNADGSWEYGPGDHGIDLGELDRAFDEAARRAEDRTVFRLMLGFIALGILLGVAGVLALREWLPGQWPMY